MIIIVKKNIFFLDQLKASCQTDISMTVEMNGTILEMY